MAPVCIISCLSCPLSYDCVYSAVYCVECNGVCVFSSELCVPIQLQPLKGHDSDKEMFCLLFTTRKQ